MSRRLLKKFNKPVSRLRRIILSEWVPVDPNNEDVVQIVTDNMAAGTQIQIDYKGSGWRLIQPYGWNTSKDGNILLMCYKDTGEIRSYRLDRINQVLVDSTQLSNEPVINGPMTPDQMYQVEDYKADPKDYEIPALPNMDEVLQISENEPGKELPYDKGIKYLVDETTQEQEVPVNNEPIKEEPVKEEPIKEEPIKEKDTKPEKSDNKEDDMLEKLDEEEKNNEK